MDFESGMGISVGRLREDTVYDYKFIGLSHNTVRGAAGGAVLCAELLTARGYIQVLHRRTEAEKDHGNREKIHLGTMPDGTEVYKYTLTNQEWGICFVYHSGRRVGFHGGA